MHPPLLFLSARERAFFACYAGGSVICAPHFFFLERKKKRAAPGAKKKEQAAALRCLGLLRIDRFLINGCVAIWKCFRMSFIYSAAAANGCGKYCIRPLRCRMLEAQLFSAAVSFGRSPQEKWKVYERYSASVGVAAQTECAWLSFSSTPCTALFFFFRREKKKRGVQTHLRAQHGKNALPLTQ